MFKDLKWHKESDGRHKTGRSSASELRINREPDLLKEAIHQGTYKLQLVACEFFQHGIKVSHPVIRFIFCETNPPQLFFLRRELHLYGVGIPKPVSSLCFILHAEEP